MFRRDFFRFINLNILALLTFRLTACGSEDPSTRKYATSGVGDSNDDALPENPTPVDDNIPDEKPEDEEPVEYVTMYDQYAMAMYFGGELGPKTGEIKVDYIIANKQVNMEFWHGHGGKQHKYVLLPEHFEQLKQGKKVTIETTSVDSHTHKLFIDPNDPKWRLPGAQPIQVPK